MYKYFLALTNAPTKLLIKLIIFCLCLLGISACSSNQSPVVYYNSFDFSEVKSYSFYPPGSKFLETQSLNYAQRNRVEIAIENSLNSQGFSYSEFSEADIIITYYFVTKHVKHYEKYNEIVRFCSRCLKASTWKDNDISWKATPGGLIIDLVNPKNNRSVWRSIYPLNYKVKDNSKEQNDKIKEAVTTMLKQYHVNNIIK